MCVPLGRESNSLAQISVPRCEVIWQWGCLGGEWQPFAGPGPVFNQKCEGDPVQCLFCTILALNRSQGRICSNAGVPNAGIWTFEVPVHAAWRKLFGERDARRCSAPTIGVQGQSLVESSHECPAGRQERRLGCLACSPWRE